MFGNDEKAKIGSVTSRWEHFHEWKRLAEEEPGVVDMETVLKGVCGKRNFIDLIENFIVFDDSSGEPRKILARNHQFLGVNRAVAAVCERREPRGRLGVFWIGFTGTPLFTGDQLTRRVFGDYVSICDFQRAVEDEATVPLYYDARGDKLGVAVGNLNERIAEKLEAFEAAGDVDVAQRLERELKRDYHVVTAGKRLDQVARDFVRHYSAAWETGKAGDGLRRPDDRRCRQARHDARIGMRRRHPPSPISGNPRQPPGRGRATGNSRLFLPPECLIVAVQRAHPGLAGIAAPSPPFPVFVCRARHPGHPGHPIGDAHRDAPVTPSPSSLYACRPLGPSPRPAPVRTLDERRRSSP